MTDLNIHTYCALKYEECDLKDINAVLRLNLEQNSKDSPQLLDWKKRYINDLEAFYVSNENLDIQRYYCDPDSTYQRGYNHQFFYELTAFLNKRENALSHELDGVFRYEFIVGEGIEVSRVSQKRRTYTPLFLLRSDQLGFSAPTKDQKHPYDAFIKASMECGNDNNAFEQVAQWIADSRTIGGSFLWPIPFYSAYNLSRGGTIYSNSSHYIQDRVDLTLWEIKHQYELYQRYSKLGRHTIMSSNNKSNLDIWLGHFKNFKTYVNFFCFDPFVTTAHNGVDPIDIFTGKPIRLDWDSLDKNPEPKITKDLELSTLETMLKVLNGCIKQRTELMHKCML